MRGYLVCCLLIGSALSATSWAGAGKERVIVKCGNNLAFDLDSWTKPSFSYPVGVAVKDPKTNGQGALWVEAEILDPGSLSQVSKDINFRVQLSSLTENFVGDTDHQTLTPLKTENFTFDEKSAQAGTAWTHDFVGPDFNLICEGRVYFANPRTYIDLSSGKAQPVTGLDAGSIVIGASQIDDGNELCGITLRSTLPSRDDQIKLLRWISIVASVGDGNENFGISFAATDHFLQPFRENFESPSGTPGLRLNLQATDSSVVWEAGLNSKTATRPSLLQALTESGEATAAQLATLTAEPNECAQ